MAGFVPLYARESVTGDRFGGRSIPEIYIPATFNSYVPLIWIQTKTLALKVCCGHLACQRSGPSLPLFTHRPKNSSTGKQDRDTGY